MVLKEVFMSVSAVFAQPITRLRLHEEIVTVIQKQIINGTILPGTKLPPERELAQTFNVNRTTLREALHKLETLELIEIRHGDGIYARNYMESSNLELVRALVYLEETNEPIFAVLEIRKILIPEMAFLAARRRTKEHVDALRKVVRSSEMSVMEKDIQVHLIIARATGNLLYNIIINFFHQIYRDLGHLYFNDPQSAKRSEVFHRDICSAIEKQNAEAARKIMADVLQYAETVIREYLEKRQEA